jgi:hypothetical protein
MFGDKTSDGSSLYTVTQCEAKAGKALGDSIKTATGPAEGKQCWRELARLRSGR